MNKMLAVALGFVLWSATAVAGPMNLGTYLDNWVGNGQTNDPSLKPDVIGSKTVFDIFSMTLAPYQIQVATNYAGKVRDDGFPSVYYGDLLLGKSSDGSNFVPTHAFVLDNPNPVSGPVAGSAILVGLPNGAGDLLTSNAVMGTPSGVIYRENELVSFNDSRINPVNTLGSGSWFVNPGTSAAPGLISFLFDWQKLTGVNALQWSMTCANDVIRIFGDLTPTPDPSTVDEGPTLAFTALGLLLLAGLQSRRKMGFKA